MNKKQEEFVLEVYHGIVVTHLLDNDKLKRAGNIVRGTPETDLIAPLLARNLVYSWYNHQYDPNKYKVETPKPKPKDDGKDRPNMKELPKGWHFMTDLVDDDGQVWNRGKKVVEEPPTFPQGDPI